MKPYSHFIKLIIFITLFPFTSGIADELKEGEWGGTFINTLDKRYKIQYNVSYKSEDEIKVLQIEMINLDLEPMAEFTYQLIDIELKNNELRFKIPREHDTKECTLTKQEDGKYSGECLSNKATSGETSQITMIPASE